MANSKLLPFPAVISGICFDASPKTAFIKAWTCHMWHIDPDHPPRNSLGRVPAIDRYVREMYTPVVPGS
jgi:hypothetical protein